MKTSSPIHYYQTDTGIGRGLLFFSLKKILLKEATLLQKESSPKILEIGTGKGRLLLEILEKFPKFEAHGINKDIEHGLKEKADFLKNAQEWNIILKDKTNLPCLHIADGTKLPFEKNTFDLIVSQVTFLHIENKARAIEEVCRTLKPGGTALIGMGPYSIRRKRGHGMSKFFTTIRKSVGEDLNPRLLLRKNKKYLPFTAIAALMNNQGYLVKTYAHTFTSPTQKARGFWLIIKKQKDSIMKLPLKYRADESKMLTRKYQRTNPVNWGWIDVYDI